MLLLPASATVHVQAAEIRTGEVCGVDMTPVNQHRWHPGYLSGVPLAPTPCGKGDGPWRGGPRAPPRGGGGGGGGAGGAPPPRGCFCDSEVEFRGQLIGSGPHREPSFSANHAAGLLKFSEDVQTGNCELLSYESEHSGEPPLRQDGVNSRFRVENHFTKADFQASRSVRACTPRSATPWKPGTLTWAPLRRSRSTRLWTCTSTPVAA